jgi:uncharacterized protein YdaU (DUF1376 family)
MASFDILPFSTSAYLSDTGHLSTTQHGAYFLILLTLWRFGGWIDGDEKTLAKVCKMPPDKWRKISADVKKLLTFKDGKVTQKRLLHEFEFETKKRKMLADRLEPESRQRQSQDSSSGANCLESIESGLPVGKTTNERASYLLLDLDSENQGKKESKGVAASSKRRAPRRTIDKDWKPTDHDVLYAKSKGFSPERIEQIARGCLLYHRKHGTLIADMEATWEHWVDNEIKFAKDRNRKTSMADIAMGRDDRVN